MRTCWKTSPSWSWEPTRLPMESSWQLRSREHSRPFWSCSRSMTLPSPKAHSQWWSRPLKCWKLLRLSLRPRDSWSANGSSSSIDTPANSSLRSSREACQPCTRWNQAQSRPTHCPLSAPFWSHTREDSMHWERLWSLTVSTWSTLESIQAESWRRSTIGMASLNKFAIGSRMCASRPDADFCTGTDLFCLTSLQRLWEIDTDSIRWTTSWWLLKIPWICCKTLSIFQAHW